MKYSIIVILALLFASCSKEDNAKGDTSAIAISASIEESATKAVVSGTSFKDGNSLGMFIYHDEQNIPLQHFTPYGERYRNIRTTYKNISGWSYRFDGSNTSFDYIYLIKPTEAPYKEGLAIYSYAPWIEGCTDIQSIPVTIGGDSKTVTDIMWAQENNTAANASIIPDGQQKNVKFTFRHGLAMLNIVLKCKHNVTEMKISSITLRKKDNGTTQLYKTGRFNAVTGTFAHENSDEAESVTTSYVNEDYRFSQTTANVPFLIFPVDNYATDGDYIIEFEFNGVALGEKYHIKKDDLKVNDEYKLKQGYSYTFNFTFNNYLQIDDVNVNVSDQWPVKQHELLF